MSNADAIEDSYELTPMQQGMLFHSLLYGHNEDFWWTRVTNPDERLAISLALIERREEAARAEQRLERRHAAAA